MAEMRGIGIADVQRHLREVAVAVYVMQQAAGTAPGSKAAERHTDFGLEEVQEAREREVDLACTVLTGGWRRGVPLDALQHQRDALVQAADWQRVAEEHRVEV